MEDQVKELEHRVTILEGKTEVLEKSHNNHDVLLTSIKEDIHKIYLTIASAKGWIIGILGVGAVLSTVANWILRIAGYH